MKATGVNSSISQKVRWCLSRNEQFRSKSGKRRHIPDIGVYAYISEQDFLSMTQSLGERAISGQAHAKY